MGEQIRPLKKQLQELGGGHIFYCFNELEHYIQNAVSYVISGIEDGDHIIIIENDRIFPLLYKMLETQLSREQLNKIHHVNNFDFYCFYGHFHPPAIVRYFSKHIEPYVEKNVSIRTWGHVEWRDLEEITDAIEAYEKEIDKIVTRKGLTTVCAYDAARVSERLKASLLNCHEFLMTDHEMIRIANKQAKSKIAYDR